MVDRNAFYKQVHGLVEISEIKYMYNNYLNPVQLNAVILNRKYKGF